MSQEIPVQPSTREGTGQDELTATQMARYELARCRSVRDLLWTYGAIEGDPTINVATEHISVLPDLSSASAGVTVEEKIRALVRFLIAACRWAYERVAL